MALYRPIPLATEPIPVESWWTIMRESAVLEQALLLSFGFAFRVSANDGVGFYRTSGDEVFTERLNRARVQTGA
jgi:hypothetical protein